MTRYPLLVGGHAIDERSEVIPPGWTAVGCRAEACRAVFPVPDRRLGRNTFCPDCGVRITAVPCDVVERLRRRERSGRASHGTAKRSSLPLVLVLDNIRSMWNVGSMFRTADACGVRELVLCGITACPPRDEIRKTALGAERAVPWRYRADTAAALAELAADGYRTVALECGDGAVPVSEYPWGGPTALVVGNEVAGVSPAAAAGCPTQVSIPMRGVKQSLNVSVACGIALHAASTAVARA